MADNINKPSLASFTDAVNKELQTPNAQKSIQSSIDQLSPVGSFKNYNFNRNDAIRYDDPDLGYLPFRNNENLYGEYQTTAEKWGAGLTKFAGKTATAVLGNLGGMVYGIGSAISNGEINKIFDNDVTRKLDEWDQNMDEEYANYYTDAEKNAGLLGRMGTANFWSDKALGGASFMAGAIISEAITSAITAATFGGAGIAQVGLTARILDKGRKLFKYTSKLDDVADIASAATRGAIRGADDMVNVVKNAAKNAPKISEYVDDAARMSNNVFDNAVNTVSKANALNRIGTYARQTVFATGFEAGVEAMHHGQQMRDDMIKSYEQTYGIKADKDVLDQIDSRAKSSEIGVFATNLALLSITNAAQFKEFSYGVRDLMSIGKKSGAKIATKDIIEETTEEGLKRFVPGFEKWSKLRKAADVGWTIAKNPIMEGPVEEGLQGVINNAFHDYNMHKYNPNGIQSSMDLSTAIGNALTKQYGTVDGWEENIIGMILGGAGIPLVSRVKDENGKTSWKFDVTGGIADELRERREKREDITNRAAFLQKTHDAFVTTTPDGKSKFDTIKFTNSIIQNSVESASILQQRDGFINAGDFKRAKDSDADLAFSYFKARYDTGRFESTVDDNIEMIEKMTPEEFGEQFQYDPNMSKSDLEKRKEDTLNSFKKEAENIKNALKQTDSILPEANENLRAGIAHAIYRGKNAEDRIQGISEKISFLTNNSVNKDTLKKALDNQYDFAAGTIADPSVPMETKKAAVNDYKNAKQLIRDIDRLEQQYNAPVLATKDEAQLEKNLAMRTELQNQIIAKKEEYLQLGKKYSAQFRVIKDINDVRLSNMIGNMKAYDELNDTIKGYVDTQGENSVEVDSLHKDLTKLLADKVNFTRLHNYLFTKKGQEEFESTDRSIKNALTQDYIKLANRYTALNTSLAEEEFARNTAAQLMLQQRVADRLSYEQEQAELNNEKYNPDENIARIYKEEYHRQKMAFLSDKYYDAALDQAEESKALSYAGRLLNKGNITNLGSFAETLKEENKEDIKKDEEKTPEELNKEITDSNKKIDDVAKETGKNLNNVKALNRSTLNAKNALVKYVTALNNGEDTTTLRKELTDKNKILKDNYELISDEFDKLSDANPDLDPKIEKIYNDHLNEADDLIKDIDKTLLENPAKSNAEKETFEMDDNIQTIVDYPNYFAKLFRGTEKSPIEGVNFNLTKNDLVDAWNENRVVIRKRRLETPIEVNANKYIKRKQDYSYDVVIKNQDGTESLVGVMSTPNSFVFVQPNGKEVPIDFTNIQHIKAFNTSFLDDTNVLNNDGLNFQEHGYDISNWEEKYLTPLEEGEEVSTDKIKEVMENITRNTFQNFSFKEAKPQLLNTATLKNFEQNAITIASINVKPRYSSTDVPFQELTGVQGMYVLDENGLILITKNEDGTIQEWNIKDANILKQSLLKRLDTKIEELKKYGTDRYLICSPLGDDIMPIGLMAPSFNSKISILDGINKLNSTEDLVDVELNTNDQGVELNTGIDLGDGFTGLILASAQQKNKTNNLPSPVIINLTSSSSEFISPAYTDPASSDNTDPQQGYIPIIPKQKTDGSVSRETSIGYKVRSSIEKNYTSKDNKISKNLKLNFNFTKNTDTGEKKFTISFLLNLNSNGKLYLVYSNKGNKKASVEIENLDDCLKTLYSRVTGSSKTILETHLENDPYLNNPNQKETLANIKSLVNNFNIGFNPSLDNTVLRKFANNVEEYLAAGEAGGRVEFTKKKSAPPKITTTDNVPPPNNSNRPSKRDTKIDSSKNIPTTPFQDFINKEFSRFITSFIQNLKSQKAILEDKNTEEEAFGAAIMDLNYKKVLSDYVANGSSEFLKWLNTTPRTRDNILDVSLAFFSLMVHNNQDLGSIYYELEKYYTSLENATGYKFKVMPFTELEELTNNLKKKFEIADAQPLPSAVSTTEEEGKDASSYTSAQLANILYNSNQDEEGNPIESNQQPPSTPLSQTNVGATPLGAVNTKPAPTTTGPLNGIGSVSFDIPGVTLEGFKIDGNYYNVLSHHGRAKTLVNINGVIVPFYLTSGQGGKGLVPGWYPFGGIGKDGWLNKTGKPDMETYYSRLIGQENADLLNTVAAKLNEQYGTDAEVFKNPDADPTTTVRPITSLADKTEDYINSKLPFIPVSNQTAGTLSGFEANMKQLGNALTNARGTQQTTEPTVVPEHINIIQSSPNRQIDFNDSVTIEYKDDKYVVSVKGMGNPIEATKNKIVYTLSKFADKINIKVVLTDEERKLSDDIESAKNAVKNLVLKESNIFAMNDNDLEAMKGKEIKHYCNI